MSAPIIFLDFDGPLFPTKSLWFPENQGQESEKKCKELDLHPYVTYWKADPFAIVALNKLYELQPYELVISSSWADETLHQKIHIENLLTHNGLNFELHKDWKTPRNNKFRHIQIGDWLTNHPEVNNYIIIDDIESGYELKDSTKIKEQKIKKSNIFLIDVANGISMSDYYKMRDKFMKI